MCNGASHVLQQKHGRQPLYFFEQSGGNVREEVRGKTKGKERRVIGRQCKREGERKGGKEGEQRHGTG